MWIVKAALRNPYTVGALAVFIFLMGFLSISAMNVDILPKIDIPVVNIIWQYTGLPAEDMENRVVFVSERGYTTSVNAIEHIESRSITGLGVIRVYFQPGVDIGAAIAQLTSSSLTSMRSMPVGMQPPTILQFNASNVPVAQITITSQSIPEDRLFDYANNFVRLKLFALPGLMTPAPYGGKIRQINVDVRPELLAAKGLSPQDVVATLNASNLIIPAGTARIGSLEYDVIMNSSPKSVEGFNQLPIKNVGRETVTLGEVANISDAFADQTNAVRINGQRATYLNILKKAEASTITVVNEVRKALPRIKANAPAGMDFKIDFDQSTFVKAAMKSVLTEALTAAVLVSIMIILFLGSWRSVFIVCTSIPLAIFTSVICLKLLDQSLNLMSLGGLSLAIGMLVDDATVEVENIDRNRKNEKNLTLAILRGASQVALPAIVSTLSICLVFSPIIMLTGPARFIFTPMALAVVFAMLASYVLSRTLVPVLADMLLPNADKQDEKNKKSGGLWQRFNDWREDRIDRLQNGYADLLEFLIEQKAIVFTFLAFVFVVSMILPFFVVGRDFFPANDAGIIKFHFRARSGSRIEETEKLVAQIEERIHTIVPASELETINSMIGVPIFFNLGFVPSDNIGAMDAEIEIALKKDHKPSLGYQQKLRTDIESRFPGSLLFFQPADLVNQVLNFGLSSTIDVQVQTRKIETGLEVAKKLQGLISTIPGAVDTRISQVFDYPSLLVDVSRVRAARMGLSQKDVSTSLLIALSSSSLYAPNFYLNPDNNVNYNVVAKVPLSKILSVDDLMRTPVTVASAASLSPSTTLNPTMVQSTDPGPAPSQLLGNLANLTTTTTINEIAHYNVQRVVDVEAGVEDRDLGGVVTDIRKAINKLGKLPKDVEIKIRGQNEVMEKAFYSLGLGVVVAIALVYLLLTILFQSWLDSIVILSALPGALIGILWMLALTGTSINVSSLMGAIMAIGIAVANSILFVSFANDQRIDKDPGAIAAAVEAGRTRLRPIMMTALAMILGMLPMSLALGEAGAQNAPLGRAVIGGLLIATCTTLFVVPLVYALLRQAPPKKFAIRREVHESEVQFDDELEEIEYGDQPARKKSSNKKASRAPARRPAHHPGGSHETNA